MEQEYHCIICSKPVGDEGFFGSISDMRISLCKQHADECNRECHNCIHRAVCLLRPMGS